MVSTEGIVKCFSVKAAFDYQGTLCSVLADKRTDRYQNSLFHSEKMRCLKEQKEHGCPPHAPTHHNLWYRVCLCGGRNWRACM